MLEEPPSNNPNSNNGYDGCNSSNLRVGNILLIKVLHHDGLSRLKYLWKLFPKVSNNLLLKDLPNPVLGRSWPILATCP